MLVLVSFGLVLLATILLVVGLLNDDGLTLIYLSIAASATAAVVLYIAFRRAKPSGEAPTTAPAPLAEEMAPPEAPTAVTPAAAPAPAAPPAPAPEPQPVSSGDEWMADADWDEGDLEFPIADYDDLTVNEIMPLLPQLYSDELDVVIERERSTKNRSTIIARLEELKEIGTDADAAEAAAEDEVLAPPPAPAPEPEPAPAPRTSSTTLLGDDLDEGDLFPIADYDDLSVAQIMPLLSQLEDDELEDVRDRELAGAGRKTLLAEIDRQLGGASEEPAPVAKKAPAKKAPAKRRATKKRAPAKKAASKKTATKKKAAASKKSTKRAKKAAKRAPRFPIDRYDELNVADIRPQLTGLSDAELRLVREREETGQGRKTILDDIDRKLS